MSAIFEKIDVRVRVRVRGFKNFHVRVRVRVRGFKNFYVRVRVCVRGSKKYQVRVRVRGYRSMSCPCPRFQKYQNNPEQFFCASQAQVSYQFHSAIQA